MKILETLRARLLKSAPSGKPSPRAAAFDAGAINDTIQRALASAGLDTRSGPIKSVTDTIGHALGRVGLAAPPLRNGASLDGTTLDDVAREVRPGYDGWHGETERSKSTPEPAQPGEFVTRSFANAAGARSYKLYVPNNYRGESGPAVPMLVMLHGCTQSPDDFAAGTRMNALAEQHGFLVVYPAQAANANGSRCWNWFRSADQHRDRGEPSLIAGITREVASSYRVDQRRIFVAGLSAGAAMAVILGATYPELYAAVGAHSGLAYGAANDVASAFGAMKRGGKPRSARAPALTPIAQRVPTIVFHGDGDQTVDARNGVAIVTQALAGGSGGSTLRASVKQGAAVDGRCYTRTVHADAADQSVVEEWVVHGGGHAWSGGSPDGSFTDASGPDASAEMVRFFNSQRRTGTS